MRPQPSGAVGPGLESQLRVPRYRDLYVIGSPSGWKTSAPKIWEDGHKWVNNNNNNPEEPPAATAEEEDNEELRDVLDRFLDAVEEPAHDKAVPTRHSFRDLGAALVDSDESVYADRGEEDIVVDDDYDDDDKSRYPDDEATSTSVCLTDSLVGDPRISRHPEAPTRMSILDGERSEAVRARFIRRVEAMIDSDNERGRERARRREPPVPKLTEGLGKAPSSHIRF